MKPSGTTGVITSGVRVMSSLNVSLAHLKFPVRGFRYQSGSRPRSRYILLMLCLARVVTPYSRSTCFLMRSRCSAVSTPTPVTLPRFLSENVSNNDAMASAFSLSSFDMSPSSLFKKSYSLGLSNLLLC